MSRFAVARVDDRVGEEGSVVAWCLVRPREARSSSIALEYAVESSGSCRAGDSELLLASLVVRSVHE
jgi:hypothetical protein